MLFPPIAINPIGHDLVLKQLNTAITHNRISTAYLFQGPQGVGKGLVAQWFAQRLLTELVADQEILKLSHPDLLWVSPKVKVKDQLLTPQEAAQLGEVNKVPQIYIEQIHSIRSFLSVPPLNHRKVVVIDGAELMNDNAQSALLKTLEEPATGHFILIQHEGDVLSTIASRAQCIRFNPLPETDFNSVLQTLNPSFLELTDLVHYANGCPGKFINAIHHCNQISAEIRNLLQIKPNSAQKLELARQLQTLPKPAQLWLLRYLQQGMWSKYRQTSIVTAIEQAIARFKLNCQPHLTWQVLLMNLPLEGVHLPPVVDWAIPETEAEEAVVTTLPQAKKPTKPKTQNKSSTTPSSKSSGSSKEPEEGGTQQIKLF